MVIELTAEQLRKLQMVELEMLVEVDRICRKNHIHYSISGGTLLGAVRHGGFIPWDDDADVSMLRGEYERFRVACEKDLNSEKYYFQDMDNTEGYRWGYGKLRRKNSIFLREHQEHLDFEQGIFIDLFPRDGIPDGKLAGKIHKFLCFAIRKMLWSDVGRNVVQNPVERLLYSLFSGIPLRMRKTAYRLLVKCSNRKPTRLVRALTFPLPRGVQGFERNWYRRYTNIKFEGHTLMAVSSYRDGLAREYGDYMTLPPVDKRKTHPVSKIKIPEGSGE